MAGYSGTPLAKKLGIKEGCKVLVVNAPGAYLKLLEPLPPEVEFVSGLTHGPDIVHTFLDNKAELEKVLASLRRKIKPAGTVWISWPKKAAKVPTDITENVVRALALSLGFVDIKVCAVDDVWSGLKLVIRKDLR
jgi:hypothetical protein